MNLKLILKGFIIGLAKIIPGVSGSLLAISLGLYDKGLMAITNFFDNPKENFKFLFNICVGLIIAIIIFSKIISYLIDNFYLPTMLLFVGLIFGGIIPLLRKIKKDGSNYILFIFCFISIILLSIININNNYIIKNNLIDLLYFFFGGMLDACGTVIPGVSGTALLMISGLYNILINILSNFYLTLNIKLVISFGLGMLIGIIIFAKLMKFLLNSYKEKTMSCILGISTGSIILLIIKTFMVQIKIPELTIGILLLIVGIYISNKLEN